MLIVTIRSAIEELSTIESGEIVVVDNSDPQPLEYVKASLPIGYVRDGTLKFHHQPFPCLFTAREKAAELASGCYILCLDSHCLLGHGMVKGLVDFMDRHGEPDLGFAHAPINWAHQHHSRAKHDRDMSRHELGDWGARHEYERPITWKGMPWICRRDWFLDRENGLNGYGALAKYQVSWGGGDMHIGVKPWLLGFKNWAVPTRPAIHIGPFPKVDLQPGDPNSTKVNPPTSERYRTYSNSGNFPHTFGFLVSCYVLGGMPMIERNLPALKERFGRYINYDKWIPKAVELGLEEREWLLAHQKISFEQLLETRPWTQIVQ